MKDLYRKTFDQIEMQTFRAEALGRLLASRCKEKEAIMKKVKFHRPVTLVAMVALILALSLSALAFGGSIYRFMTGGVVTVGEENTSASMEDMTPPVEERDGRLYLVINGQNKDITGLCSYTEPYIYTCTGDDGLQHAFIIGGSDGAIGWAEFFWDEAGVPMAGSAAFGTSEGSEDAPWLEAGMDELGLPW